jgi:hypothetical protein
MTNQEFLKQTIAAFKFIELGLKDLLLAIKNSDSIMLFCTQPYVTLLGLKNLAEVIGSECIMDTFGKFNRHDVLKEDQSVIKSRKRHYTLKIHKFCGKIQPMLSMKEPIINPHTNEVVAIFIQTSKLSMASFSQEIIKSLSNTKIINSSARQAYKLSKREKQVIFLFLSHLSSQEIADILSKMDTKKIAKSTIDGIFTEQLFVKFNVVNRVGLRKKLNELGYTQAIPAEILDGTIIPLQELQVY